MKTEKNILVAFLLNAFFSIFELFGGIFTGSVAIMSDAIHDFGDAFSIGISYFFERKSNKAPDNKYTYGYKRYSVLGALITTSVLAGGECLVIYNAVLRLFNPVALNYNGMIIFAIIGVVMNSIAAYATREGDSLNQKAVNLHMLEDVLGWIIVLIGSIVMRFTNISLLDSIMSIGVAIYILVHTIGNFSNIIDIFLVKTPKNIDLDEIKEHVEGVRGVISAHHIHVWSLNGEDLYCTMHVKSKSKNLHKLKENIREELGEHGIIHVTIEIEDEDDLCHDEKCSVKESTHKIGHHHH